MLVLAQAVIHPPEQGEAPHLPAPVVHLPHHGQGLLERDTRVLVLAQAIVDRAQIHEGTRFLGRVMPLPSHGHARAREAVAHEHLGPG